MIRGVVDESKRPMQALAGYREIFGAQATPELVVYDRGGYAAATLRALAQAGVNEIGIPPKGKGVWRVADRKSTRLNSSHIQKSRMPSSA